VRKIGGRRKNTLSETISQPCDEGLQPLLLALYVEFYADFAALVFWEYTTVSQFSNKQVEIISSQTNTINTRRMLARSVALLGFSPEVSWLCFWAM
jgi:hypothetical protein